MSKPIIDPSTLTKRQKEKLRFIYESDTLNLEGAELGYKWLLNGGIHRMELIFGEDFFKKGK